MAASNFLQGSDFFPQPPPPLALWQCPLETPIKVPAPDYFSGNTGEDAKLWLNRLERYHVCCGIGPEIAPFVFPARLKGLADQWFNRLPDPVKKDYDLLRAAFLERFSNEVDQFSDGLQQFSDLASKGIAKEIDWDGLVLEHSGICDKLGFTKDYQRVESFISILPPEIKGYMKCVNHSDTTQCARHAKWIMDSTINNNVQETRTKTDYDTTKSKQGFQVNQVTNEAQTKDKSKQNKNLKAKQNKRNKWPCTKCGSNSHKVEKCHVISKVKTKTVSSQTDNKSKLSSQTSSTQTETTPKGASSKNNGLSKQANGNVKSKVEGLNVCPILDLSDSSHVTVNCSNGVQLHTLMDTGANCNCISLDAYNRLSPCDKTPIQSCEFTQANSAGGSPLLVEGSSTITFGLDNSCYETSVCVVDGLVVDFILGTTFLTEQGAVIDYSKNQIKLNDNYTLIMPTDFTIKEQSEVTLLVSIKGNLANAIDGLIKPNSLVRSLGLYMANTLSSTKGNKVAIRLLNPFDKPFKIKAKTKLGTFSPLSSSDSIQNLGDPENLSKSQNNPQVNQMSQTSTSSENAQNSSPNKSKHHHNLDFSEARECLKETIDLSKSDLTEQQKEQLLDLLANHREAFSLKGELGNCTLIDHEIPLKPGTRPIYQRPYRYSMFAMTRRVSTYLLFWKKV